MFAEVFQGIMMILFSIGIYALGLYFSRDKMRFGAYIRCYGTIADADPTTGIVIVSYELDGTMYSAPCNEELRAKTDGLPEVGQNISVMIMPDEPEKPIHIIYQRQMGKGYNGIRKYLDAGKKKNVRSCILCGTAFLVFGLHQLLVGFRII